MTRIGNQTRDAGTTHGPGNLEFAPVAGAAATGRELDDHALDRVAGGFGFGFGGFHGFGGHFGGHR